MRIPHASPSWAFRWGVAQCALLLGIATVPLPAEWEGVKGLVDSARSPELNRAERAEGYYEGLIRGDGVDPARGEQSLRLLGKPTGWVRFQEADVVHYLEDDFLQFELKPSVSRTLFGQPFTTNAHGMHDDPVELEKPPGVFRVALLGSSIDMGWGVDHRDAYANRLETWLGEHEKRLGREPLRSFEVLNFAVAAYSPVQRLETLARKAMAFKPDLVIYSATTLDARLIEIHLREILRKRVDLKYDFLRRAVAAARIIPADLEVDGGGRMVNKDRLKAKLRPYYWDLYDQTLSALAGECQGAGVPLVMIIVPRVGKSDAPAARAEPVAMLKAVASRHGLPVYDLTPSFDHDDPSTLEIAAWDDHPNALGHRRLFTALARALVHDPETYARIFPGATAHAAAGR